MDKKTFASYKFNPSDVIEGLNRYFALTKANCYLIVPLEIRRGICFNNPYCVKDIVFTNSPPDRHTRSGHVCWNYYLICDPEEAVSVAINWLREEHDIFYTPGMAVTQYKPEELTWDDAKSVRDVIHAPGMVDIARVREALGIADDSDIFQCIKYRNELINVLRQDLATSRRMYNNAIHLKAATFPNLCAERDHYCAERDHYKKLYENLKNSVGSVLQEAENKED